MSTSPANARAEGTPVAWPFRVWLGIEVLFGLASISVVGLRPDETATRFAWHIEPEVMAAALGGLYFATAPVFVLAVLARRWEMIRVLVPAIIPFTIAELAATLLHLDKFSVGTLPFNVWLASYVLPPGIFLLMYVYHQRRATPHASGHPIPRGVRRALLIGGALFTLDGLVGFALPSYFTLSFPWMLTPLTARVLAGWLIAVGVLMLSMFRENDRDRVRIGTPLLILALPAMAIEVSRFASQIDFTSPRLWFGVAYFSFVAALGLYLARGSWRTSLT